jgi:hypothetical protein
MKGNTLRVGWFWTRVGFRRRWANYLAVVLLVAFIGGLAIGSVAAARRTQSSYNEFLASTNPSDLTVTLFAPNVAPELAKLRHVKRVVVSSYSVNAFPANRNGKPTYPQAMADGDITPAGSLSGEYFSVDKVAVVSGRMANPRRANEFMIDVNGARLMGWHLGETIPMDVYTDAQEEGPNFKKVKPAVAIRMHLVGLIVPNSAVLLDQIDRYPELMIFTPALTRMVVNNGEHYNQYALQLDNGVRSLSIVEREIIAALPRGTTYSFRVNSVVAAEVNGSIEPESIALGVFGFIAGLAALVIAAGLISRTMRRENGDLEILRALGASPAMVAIAGLLGLIGTIIVSAVLADVVAVALSPFSPLGPVRPVYPYRGVAFDWPVLGSGFAVLVVLLSLFAVAITRRRLQRASGQRRETRLPVSSKVARLATDVGLPVSAVVGVHFALETGGDRDAAPVRSALVGSALAVAILVATVTFGSSLSTLVTHPSLYGWNWNYALAGNGSGVPPQAAKLLNADPYVAEWSGDDFANAQINGVTVPIILTNYRAVVTAPILSGHEVDRPGQIVLGAATLKQLHKSVGDVVTVQYGSPKDAPVYVPPTKERIVGVATLPAIGGTLSLHSEMGVGAFIPLLIEPPAFRKYLHAPYEALNGYSDLFVRLKKGAPRAAALASLQRIARVGTKALGATPGGGGEEVSVLGVQYPAEIENYRAIGVTPDVLALALALGAVVALALTLIASVNRRRRDLALLRTLGFTSRQLVATVASQASVAAVVGVVLGVPIGIVAGRWLWTLFANSVYVVPEPTIPVLSVVIVSLGAIVLANIVAALPGRSAAKTSTARILRGE